MRKNLVIAADPCDALHDDVVFDSSAITDPRVGADDAKITDSHIATQLRFWIHDGGRCDLNTHADIPIDGSMMWGGNDEDDCG